MNILYTVRLSVRKEENDGQDGVRRDQPGSVRQYTRHRRCKKHRKMIKQIQHDKGKHDEDLQGQQAHAVHRHADDVVHDVDEADRDRRRRRKQEPLHPGVSAIMAEAALDNDIIPSQPSDAKMLIVEDDASIREMLADIFRTFYQVITASDGVEAMELVEKEMPSIVLSDVVMPRMSGTELCKQIKKEFNTCHIPVVLLTARTAVEHTVEGLRIGADDYITKPFNINILVSRCNNLVNSRIQLQEKFTRQPQAFAQILATNPMDKEMLDRAMEIIEKYLDDSEFNVNTFAREMGMARTNLFSKLKAVTGQTPNDFILTIRLKKGAIMLRSNPELNITEISDRVGFSSSRYFSKCFKDVYHVSPMSYRKGKESEDEE